MSLLSFQGDLLPSGEKTRTSRTLVIDSVDRHEAGTYVCRAHNGVGNKRAQAAIKLQVLCELIFKQTFLCLSL